MQLGRNALLSLPDCNSFPAGAPGQDPRPRHQRRHTTWFHWTSWFEPSKEYLAKLMSSAPLAFCRLKCEGSHVVHLCRNIDAPSCQIVFLPLISRLELEARVTKRGLEGLARIQPSEVPRARRSHMVLLLAQVEGSADGVSWGTDPG